MAGLLGLVRRARDGSLFAPSFLNFFAAFPSRNDLNESLLLWLRALTLSEVVGKCLVEVRANFCLLVYADLCSYALNVISRSMTPEQFCVTLFTFVRNRKRACYLPFKLCNKQLLDLILTGRTNPCVIRGKSNLHNIKSEVFAHQIAR